MPNKFIYIAAITIYVYISLFRLCYAQEIFIISDNNDTRLNVSKLLSIKLKSTLKNNIHTLTTEKHYIKTSKKKVRKNDLIITIGSKALRFALQNNLSNTILSGNISRLSISNFDIPDHIKFYSVYIEPPPEKQLKLAQKHIPVDGSIGIVLGPYSFSHINDYKKAEKNITAKLNIYTADKDNIIEKIKSSVKNNISIAVFDPVILNNNHAQWLLYSAYLKRTPVIGFSSSFLNAGSAMSIYSSQQDTIDNIYNVALNIIRKRKVSPRRNYSEKYTIEYNAWVSDELNINTNSDVK